MEFFFLKEKISDMNDIGFNRFKISSQYEETLIPAKSTMLVSEAHLGNGDAPLACEC